MEKFFYQRLSLAFKKLYFEGLQAFYLFAKLKIIDIPDAHTRIFRALGYVQNPQGCSQKLKPV